MTPHERITALQAACDGPSPNFPVTDLYNEGWMLRLVLDWLESNPGMGGELAFEESDRWYSEALLPSRFRPMHRGDPLSEARTHADGAVGHFEIGVKNEGDLSLRTGATRLYITEAKMFSKLSSGVKNASYYNQAARNVACIAEVIDRASISLGSMEKIGFYVIAPESRIAEGTFSPFMSKEHIREIVRQRVSEYDGDSYRQWFIDCFEPMLTIMQIRVVAWEEILGLIAQVDSEYGRELQFFYEKCLRFNQSVASRFG